MSYWVKFHEEICLGAKRGWPRATRFILMELSLKARKRRGTVDLPLGMDDVDGVHDLIGGNRHEIVKALGILTSGEDPVLALDGDVGARRLVIPSWARWNSIEPEGASTQRTRRHRATIGERLGNGEGTVRERGSNGEGTLPRGEESREDKNRGDGEARGGAPESDGSDPPSPVAEPLVLIPTEAAKPPSPGEQVFEAYVAAWRVHVGRGQAPVHTPKRAKLIATRLREGFTAEQLTYAARGVWLDSWLRDKGLASLEVALRDAGQVEKFSRLVENGPPPRHDHRGRPMQSGGPDFTPKEP